MKDFYTVTSITTKDNREYTFGVSLNKTHRIYQGHFPQQPVVPGVCMMLMTREIAEKAMGCNLMYKEVSNIKFMSLVDPAINNELTIKLTIDSIETGGYNVKASIEFVDKIFFTIKGSLSDIITCQTTGGSFSGADSSVVDNLELEG
jgi:3-hydroxyacyl-[acyl-carrier-protein] dehydratase